ncbi:MAG: geranylgeranyl reductase family protein [Lewinella sp.]|nr:geranylgeranyl reductase family protein [Lewinella sp.]
MRETDICIVGAGPGGAGAALRLSYLGISSVLIDKAQFPRDKICGDAISGKVTTLLGRLDPAMLARFRQRAIHIDVWGIRFIPPNDCLIELPFKVGYERDPQAAPGYVSKRLDFDNFLIEEVRRRPDIEFHEGTEITRYERTKRGWRIFDQTGRLTIDCRLLLVADGAHSHFSRHIAGHEKENAHHAAAVRAYYRGVTGFHPDNFIELHFLPELNPGYFWIFPLPNGYANVGLGMRSDFVQKRRLNLREQLEKAIEHNPQVKARFAQAERQGKIVGYGLPLGSKRRALSGDHYMLLGDAGHLIDPLTGEGIGNAFYSGFIAAELAEHCLQEARFEADYLRAYDVRVDRVLRAEMRLSYQLQRVMQNVWLTNLLTRFIANHPRIIELLCRMYTDFDLRKQLVRPWFWVKMWLRGGKASAPVSEEVKG